LVGKKKEEHRPKLECLEDYTTLYAHLHTGFTFDFFAIFFIP
jgi:hypothetical protein